MYKKILSLIATILFISVIFFIGAGISLAKSSQPVFVENGYVIEHAKEDSKHLNFKSEEKYTHKKSGEVSFKDTEGEMISIDENNFAHLDNGAIYSFANGVLLDFNDLSENFINNYQISSGLQISESGSEYVANSDSGVTKFGEHLWKLSNDNYLIRSKKLKVFFSEDDVRETTDFVEVHISDDGIAQIMTSENHWNTISPDCYIETEGGVKIYPIEEMADNGEYKMSLAKLTVNVDEAIVLSANEHRRQIVPKLNINTIDGEDGENGVSGEQGEGGTNGSKGEQGKGGAGGGNGMDGKDAVGESSTNSALPTMTITDWKVTSNSLKGKIQILDENQFLGWGPSDPDKYLGNIRIYNEKTGDVINCYETESDYSEEGIDLASPGINGFLNNAEEVYFTTSGNPLEPDTSYRLSVNAYYKMNDTVYSREFISRIFYTDSTGAHLSYDSAKENELSYKVRISDANQEYMESVDVVLLTPEQNANFKLATAETTNEYVQRISIDYQSKTIKRISPSPEGPITEVIPGSPSFNHVITFDNLISNTKYITRIISKSSGIKSLTNQEVVGKTLKVKPTWKDNPIVSFNRVTGAFEVVKPIITDPDNGIVNYIYKAIDSEGKVISKQTVPSNLSYPVDFNLPVGGTYRFELETEFNDNEKTVLFKIGQTEQIKSEGDTLPLVKFNIENQGVEYNTVKGTIVINLSSPNSSLTVDSKHPLELNIFADQIYNKQIVIDRKNEDIIEKDSYKISYDDKNGNFINIHTELLNLYKNTNYTITLVGYLNLNDGNDATKRTIGTVSFKTYDTPEMVAMWSANPNGTTAINQILKLSSQDEERKDYALSELQKGKCNLELYSGTGVGKTRIAFKEITDPNQLAQLYGEGYNVTEADFGNLNLNPNSDYTLTVTEVIDCTYKMSLDYKNKFTTVKNNSLPITAMATPPDLTTEPQNGVIATPILNIDAPIYGEVIDKALPDEAIIGYRLDAKYDNVQRLGYSVTYYAMEYSEFYNSLVESRVDPIKYGNHLMEMTQPISQSSDTVPSVAVLFKGDKTADKDAVMYNGAYVYHAGEAQSSPTGLVSGMERGFRYIFAYTVKYSNTGSFDEGSLVEYPYAHSDYAGVRANYKAAYGCGKQYGKSLGKGVAYVLNSGMKEAPRLDPEVHTYLYSDVAEDYSSNQSKGKVTIHYRYRDLDKTIRDQGPYEERTQIKYYVGEGENKRLVLSQPINADENRIDGTNDWYSFIVPYTIFNLEENPIIEPTITIDRYLINYELILEDLLSGTNIENKDRSDFYLCHTPIEISYGMMFDSMPSESSGGIKIKCDFSHLDENYLLYRFSSGAVSTLHESLAERAYALKLTFKTKDKTVGPLYFPIEQDYLGLYTRVATGFLTEIVNEEYQVTASVLYDNGNQGWKLLEDKDAMFGIQHINKGGKNPVFGFDNYFTNSRGNTGGYPSSGLLKQTSGSNVNPENLRKTLDNLDKQEKISAHFSYLTKNTGYPYTSTYLYVDHYGVDSHSDSNIEQLSGRYIVPKGVSEYPLEFEGGPSASEGIITSITPSITLSNYRSTTDSIKIYNFVTQGWEHADLEDGKYWVHAGVFNSLDDAKNLSNPVKIVNFELNDKGGNDYSNSINGLESNRVYYLAMWMRIDDKNVILMNTTTTKQAIYEFSTISNVGITSDLGVIYYNEGYFEKSLKLSFQVTQAIGFNVKYDIYASESDAKKNNNVLLSDEEMRDANIISGPSDLGQTSNMVTFNLEPHIDRNKLEPGKTYYLKLTVFEDSGSEAGKEIFEFTIPPIGNYGALVYAKDANANSLSFQVTLNDLQYSMMGRKDSDGQQTAEGALYAVRFTDKDGYLLKTKFDDKLYGGSIPKNTFVFNEDCLTLKNSLTKQKISPETEYQIHIFAVVDEKHNGLSSPIDLEGNRKNWKEFFDGPNNNSFNDLIDSFWDSNTYLPKEEMETIKNKFEIAVKSQMTTNESGILINDKTGASITRTGSNSLDLVLAESYGLIKEDGSQAFKRIDWSVTGYSVDNKPVSLFGSSLDTKGDKIFTKTEDKAGYNVYNFNIPAVIPEGNYHIVIQLYERDNSRSPFKTLSFTHRD